MQMSKKTAKYTSMDATLDVGSKTSPIKEITWPRGGKNGQ
jgi:hypothetical protein